MTKLPMVTPTMIAENDCHQPKPNTGRSPAKMNSE